LQEQVLSGARHVGHLVSRFFGHVRATGLTPQEQQQVHDRLDAVGAELFWAQSAADQRHAFDVAVGVDTALPGDDEAFVAALLHDVGKRHTALGALRRSIATVLDGTGLPMTTSMRRYRRHGLIGAADLSAAGFDGIIVAFAAHHPDPAPAGIDEERWNALLEADGG
jgi:HD-like signal output (HDOD) protein